MPKSAPLNDIEKGVIQILISKGIVEGRIFDNYLNTIIQEHINNIDPSFVITNKETIFKHINDHIKSYSMEVKTLVIIDNNNENIFYHGIVNTDEDFIAKEYGIGFDTIEIKFFNDLLSKLITDGHLTTHDIESLDFIPGSWNSTKLFNVLIKLNDNGWLLRDDRNYWNIGLKSYIELRRFMETVINQIEPEEDEIRTGIKLNDLPQLIIY